eukprot:TRINITY_DN1439_c0_g1_i3.p1 TRINITY_DN1439_c0_g1~~TRINITY_DN1439_c0_g1_i3.p1  ORF type:complete len:1103 (-),score=253.82 TRINITY_DN1439_c0_g1_i3:126-3434(-)
MANEGERTSNGLTEKERKRTVLTGLVDRIVEHINAITQSLGASLEEYQNEQERDEKEIYAIEKQLRVLQVLHDCIEFERTHALKLFEKGAKQNGQKDKEVSRTQQEDVAMNENVSVEQNNNQPIVKSEPIEDTTTLLPIKEEPANEENQNPQPTQARDKTKGVDFTDEETPSTKRQRTITSVEQAMNGKQDGMIDNNAQRSPSANTELSMFPPASPVTPVGSPRIERSSRDQQSSSSSTTAAAGGAAIDASSYNSLYQAVALSLSQNNNSNSNNNNSNNNSKASAPPQTNPFWDPKISEEASPVTPSMPAPTAPLMPHMTHMPFVYPPPMSLDNTYWSKQDMPPHLPPHMIPISPFVSPLMYPSHFYESPGSSSPALHATQSPHLSSSSQANNANPTTSGIVSGGLVTSKLFLSAPPGTLTDEFLSEAIYPIQPKAIKVHGKGYAFLLLGSVNDSLEARNKLKAVFANNSRIIITFSPLNPEKDQRMTEQYTPISEVLFLGTAGVDLPSTEVMLQGIRDKVLHVHNGTGFHLVKFDSVQSAAHAKVYLSQQFPSLTVRYSNKDLSLSMAVAGNKSSGYPNKFEKQEFQFQTKQEFQFQSKQESEQSSTTTTTTSSSENNNNNNSNNSINNNNYFNSNNNNNNNNHSTNMTTPPTVTWTVSGSGTGLSVSPPTSETVKKIIKIPTRKIEEVELDPLSSPPSRGVYIGGLGNFYSADELWESLMKLYAIDNTLMPSSIRLYYTKAFAFVYYETIPIAEKVIAKLRQPNSQYRVWQANIGFVSNPDSTPVSNKLIWVCGLDRNVPTSHLHLQMAKFGTVTSIIREGASAIVYFSLIEGALQACKELQNTDIENSNQGLRLFLVRFDEVMLSCPIHSFYSTPPTHSLVIFGHQITGLSNSQLHMLLGDNQKAPKKDKGIVSILTLPQTAPGTSTPVGPGSSPFVMVTFQTPTHASKTKELIMGLFPSVKIYYRNTATGPLEGIGSSFLLVKNVETAALAPTTTTTTTTQPVATTAIASTSTPTASPITSPPTADNSLKFFSDVQRMFLGLGIPFQGVLTFSNPENNRGFDLALIYCTEQQARRSKEGCVSKKVYCELVKQIDTFTL